MMKNLYYTLQAILVIAAGSFAAMIYMSDQRSLLFRTTGLCIIAASLISVATLYHPALQYQASRQVLFLKYRQVVWIVIVVYSIICAPMLLVSPRDKNAKEGSNTEASILRKQIETGVVRQIIKDMLSFRNESEMRDYVNRIALQGDDAAKLLASVYIQSNNETIRRIIVEELAVMTSMPLGDKYKADSPRDVREGIRRDIDAWYISGRDI